MHVKTIEMDVSVEDGVFDTGDMLDFVIAGIWVLYSAGSQCCCQGRVRFLGVVNYDLELPCAYSQQHDSEHHHSQ